MAMNLDHRTHYRPLGTRGLQGRTILLAWALVAIIAAPLTAESWPTYRRDRSRCAATSEQLPEDLSLRWSFVSTHPPKPAWPKPAEERPRMHSDAALHVAAAEGKVFFGSSMTDEVYAIDADTGRLAWRFYTEGPIRFAPSVADGRVYVGSDDGHLYCLDAQTGSVQWKYRPGRTDEKVLGNGRMISLWPVRTGTLVEDGVVYCTAGVFPYEGLYLCALNAENGTVIWRNDTIGDRAHELAYGGITPHGYLLASEDLLYVPTGRAMPAAFNRKTGEFHFWAAPGGKQGGTWTLLDGNQLIAGVDRSGTPHKVAYEAESGKSAGDVFAWFPGIDIVLRENIAYVLTADSVYAIDRDAHAEAVRKVNASAAQRTALSKELTQLRAKKKAETIEAAQTRKIERRIEEIGLITAQHLAEERRLREGSYLWRHEMEGFESLMLAGQTLFVGGQGRVVGIDAPGGRQVWASEVAGAAVGLAAAQGHLIVSTDQGHVLCFGKPAPGTSPQEIKVELQPNHFAEDVNWRALVRAIIRDTGIDRGYVLVLDSQTGALAYELCQATDLQIVVLQNDPSKLQVLRETFRSAGLLGTRITVQPWSIESLPPYFANLIVSERQLAGRGEVQANESLYRLLRPSGGTLVTTLVNGADGPHCRLLRRPELEGANGWTQQYGNPQNTACSMDKATGGPLGVLWFGEPGPLNMVERHARAQSPLSMDGRLFIEGEEVIVAVDAYNGTLLWRREIPGAVRVRVDVDGGNLALDETGLYVAVFDRCLQLDPATGQTRQVYSLPTSGAKSHRWGNVMIQDGILFGVRAEPMKQPYAADLLARHADPTDETLWAYKRANAKWLPMANYPLWENYSPEKGSVTGLMMAGDMVCALDPKTAETLWTHQGHQIANVTLSAGGGKVFLADCVTSDSLRAQALAERDHLIADGTYVETEVMKRAGSYVPSDVRLAMALDAKTGKKLWERPIDFTGCCGDAMGSAYSDDVLLFFGCVGNHDAYRFREDQLTYRRIVALSASTGEILWSRPMNYRTRPVVIEDRIIIEPRACDLHTGKVLTRLDPVSGKDVPWEFLRPGHTCAATSASADALFYRSYCTAIYDLVRDAGVTLFGGIRPGCWINMIPASGVVLIPEASVGCTCSFPLRCSYALAHKPDHAQPWTVFISHTELDEKGVVVPQSFDKPVKHLAINFGAPADMKDDQGRLWLAYPNPKTVYLANHFSNYGVKFDLKETILDGMGYFGRDFKGVTIRGTDKPWLFASGCLGLLACEIPLIDESPDQGKALYTVRLGFRSQPTDRPGHRAFDIKLQGRTVSPAFDAATGSGLDEARFCEFKDIAVDDKLALALVPRAQGPTKLQAPLISCLELIRQD